MVISRNWGCFPSIKICPPFSAMAVILAELGPRIKTMEGLRIYLQKTKMDGIDSLAGINH